MMPNDVCSGHRIGTAEVESALVSHSQCAEAAVVGVEHEVYFRHVCVCVCVWGEMGKMGIVQLIK